MSDSIPRMDPGGFMDSWIVHLFVMLLGYATVFVPGYFAIQYFRKNRYDERPSEYA